jgi:hypothetical protein
MAAARMALVEALVANPVMTTLSKTSSVETSLDALALSG